MNDISIPRNFADAMVGGIADFPISIADAFGYHEKAKEWESYVERNFPTEPGVSQFLGSVVGGMLPTVPAVLMGGSGLAAQAPKLFTGLRALTTGTYVGQAVGTARREIAEEEERTGEDISGLREASAAIGYGAVTLAAEHFGLQNLLKGIGNVAPETVRRFGSAIGRGNKEEASRILKYMGQVTARGAGQEGLQEVTEQIAQNAVSKAIYDTDRSILEGAGQSFIGGAIGGGLVHGIGISSAISPGIAGYREGVAFREEYNTAIGELNSLERELGSGVFMLEGGAQEEGINVETARRFGLKEIEKAWGDESISARINEKAKEMTDIPRIIQEKYPEALTREKRPVLEKLDKVITKVYDYVNFVEKEKEKLLADKDRFISLDEPVTEESMAYLIKIAANELFPEAKYNLFNRDTISIYPYAQKTVQEKKEKYARDSEIYNFSIEKIPNIKKAISSLTEEGKIPFAAKNFLFNAIDLAQKSKTDNVPLVDALSKTVKLINDYQKQVEGSGYLGETFGFFINRVEDFSGKKDIRQITKLLPRYNVPVDDDVPVEISHEYVSNPVDPVRLTRALYAIDVLKEKVPTAWNLLTKLRTPGNPSGVVLQGDIGYLAATGGGSSARYIPRANFIHAKTGYDSLIDTFTIMAHELRHAIQQDRDPRIFYGSEQDLPWEERPWEIDAQEYAWQKATWAAKEMGKGNIIQFQTSPFLSIETSMFKMRFEGSVVTDRKGNPLPLYHGTPAVFTKFRKAVGGIHFGNPDQVAERLGLKSRQSVIDEPPLNVIPVFLCVKQPFVCADAGSHNDIEVFLKSLIDDADINFENEEEANKFKENADKILRDYAMQWDKEYDAKNAEYRMLTETFNQTFYGAYILPFLNSYGFDGLRYKNTGERIIPKVRGLKLRKKEDVERVLVSLTNFYNRFNSDPAKYAVNVSRNTRENIIYTDSIYNIVSAALSEYLDNKVVETTDSYMSNYIKEEIELLSYISMSHVVNFLADRMDEAGLDTSNIKVTDSLSYAVFDSIDIIPMFSPDTYMQTRRGHAIATNRDEDYLIKSLRKTGIVRNVHKARDAEDWAAFVRKAAEAKGVQADPSNTYGISIGQDIYLAPQTFTNTVGHELFHAFVNLLGEQNELVQQGIAMMREEGFDGRDGNMAPMEALADIVGDVFYQRSMPASLFHKVMQWLNDFWIEVKRVLGGRLSTEQVASLINKAMESPGMIRNALGLPQEWQPIDETIKEMLNKNGLHASATDTPEVVTARLMALYERGKQHKDYNTDPRTEDIRGDKERVYNSASDIQLSDMIRASESILNDPNLVMEELRKVAENRYMEYNANTNVVWYFMIEQGRKDVIDRFVQGGESAPSLEEVIQSLNRVLEMEKSRVVHPASMSGYNLKFWDEHRTVQNLLKNLGRLKTKLAPETYNVLFQVATGQTSIDSKEAQAALEEALKHPSGKDLFYEFYYSNILSNPTTHLVNFFTNALWLGWQVPHRMLEGLVAKATGNNVFMRESIPLIFGHRSMTKIGWNFVKVLLKKGYLDKSDMGNLLSAGILDKFEYDLGIAAAAAWERHPRLKMIAPLVTWSSRALRAADLYFRTIAFGRQLSANVYRYALQQGVKNPLDVTNKVVSIISTMKTNKEESLSIASEVVGKFGLKLGGETINEIINDSIAFANYATFMDRPGKATEKIIELRNSVPFGKLFIPFVNTVMNIAKRGVEMTPGVGLLAYKAVNKEREEGGRKSRPFRKTSADIISKQIEGAIITAILLRMFDRDEITAGVPINPAEREHFYTQGKLPWSFNAGGTWIQYRDIEPFSTVFAALGSVYRAIEGAKDDQTKTEIFQQAAYNFYSYIAESTWAGALTKMGDSYKVKQQVARIPANLVPSSAAFAALNKGLESIAEGKRTLVERPETFYREVMQNIRKTVPGLSALGAGESTRLNVWGEEVSIPGGFLRQWLPIKWSEERKDATEDELARLGVYPAPPSDNITIRRRRYKIPEEEYRKYLLWFGSEAKTRLDKVVSRPGFLYLPEERKLRLLDRNLRQVRFRSQQKIRRELLKRQRSLEPLQA